MGVRTCLGLYEFLAQPPDALFAIGNAKTLAGWMQINVEPRFTDVNARVNCVVGSYGCHLALHTGLAPQSSVQTPSRGGRTKLSRKPEAYGTDGPARPPQEGWPSFLRHPHHCVIRARSQHARDRMRGNASFSARIKPSTELAQVRASPDRRKRCIARRRSQGRRPSYGPPRPPSR